MVRFFHLESVHTAGTAGAAAPSAAWNPFAPSGTDEADDFLTVDIQIQASGVEGRHVAPQAGGAGMSWRMSWNARGVRSSRSAVCRGDIR